MTETTNEELLSRISAMENNLTVLIESLSIRLESTLLTPTVKKQVNKKNVAKEPKNNSSTVKVATNTMYWWREMYVSRNEELISEFCNNEVESRVLEANPDLDVTDSVGRKKISLIIWKGFGDAKKKQIKDRFTVWKQEQSKENAPTVNQEIKSDDDTES
jgi:hypothetical protein